MAIVGCSGDVEMVSHRPFAFLVINDRDGVVNNRQEFLSVYDQVEGEGLFR